MGEFFGGALASLDLNGDGLDDLVVGSPLATGEQVRRKRSTGKYLKVKTWYEISLADLKTKQLIVQAA